MSKSRKRRKERTRLLGLNKPKDEAECGAPACETASSAPESGGRGEEPYLTPVQENKIIASMLAGNWPVGDMHKEAAVAVTVRNMAKDDGRISNGAVRNLISMEGQRMGHQKTAAGGETLNVKHSGTLTIEERREFWVTLRGALIHVPEAYAAVDKLLQERVGLNGTNGTAHQ